MSTITCDRPHYSGRFWAGLELGGVLALLELKLWWLRFTKVLWIDIVLVTAMSLLVCWSFYRRWRMPLPVRHQARGWLEGMVITGMLIGILLLGALLLREPFEPFFESVSQRSPQSLLTFFARKLGTVALQQAMVMFFLWPLCRELAGAHRGGLWLAAAIFGLIHLPVWPMMFLTVVVALLWIPLYDRNGVLAPLIVSHFLLGLVLNETWPQQYTCGMTVGMDAVARRERENGLLTEEMRQQLRFMSSQHYFNLAGGTPRGFIQAVYRDVLQRPAGEQEVNYWLERYDSYTSPARIPELLFRCRPRAGS